MSAQRTLQTLVISLVLALSLALPIVEAAGMEPLQAPGFNACGYRQTECVPKSSFAARTSDPHRPHFLEH
ncbi:MAG TPA: hypothetical protein VFV93_03135 [Thermomicrobiales bacterium]|nr:hypothetical protein [Thermomicrobiales bacterium]